MNYPMIEIRGYSPERIKRIFSISVLEALDYSDIFLVNLHLKDFASLSFIFYILQ